MSDSVVYGESYRVWYILNGSQSTMPTLANNSLTYNMFVEKSVLSNDQKKRKWGCIFEQQMDRGWRIWDSKGEKGHL